MSFNDMTLIDLKRIADDFGVESPTKITKQKLIDLLFEEGVTYDVYAHFDKLSKDASEKQEEEMQFVPAPQIINSFMQNTILVKMDRANLSYQVGRYIFTQDHPFVAMTQEDANVLFSTEQGFRVANPIEAQQFYS